MLYNNYRNAFMHVKAFLTALRYICVFEFNSSAKLDKIRSENTKA